MTDIFGYLMNKTPEVEFNDVRVEDFDMETLSHFSDKDGIFTKSFDIAVKGKKRFSEVFIISSISRYESENGQIPAAQIRIINTKGETFYYSPVYEIGSDREFYRKEWRIPPTIDCYDTVRISFIIPEGVRLFIRDFKIKSNYGYREKDIGIRYHGHGGCTCAFGMQMTAEVGFTSCITIPKFTKDGIGVCMHDDTTIKDEMGYSDGRPIEEGGPHDKPISEFTYTELMQFCNSWGKRRGDIFLGMKVPTMEEYFRICSMTGMQPIFSVHPALTKEQWLYVRNLLIKYRLLEHFWVKSGQINTQRLCLEVFGTDIAGHILIFGAKNKWDPAELAREIGFDLSRNNVVVEYFNHIVTEEQIINAKNEGFNVSIAAMRGGASGPHMKKLIDLGVSEFTVDHHCSMGLDW
jgi:hypothetical protein